MKLKKQHLGFGVLLLGLVLSVALIIKVEVERRSSSSSEDLHLASFFEELEDGRVQCNLCPNRCILSEGQRGLCGVRENIGGKLYSLVYGKPVTTHIDPMEKKPMYHFLPGEKIYSLATAGCNLDCKYCQNWDIAHRKPEDVKFRPMTPEEVVNEAINLGSTAIAFTYNEPTVWYEFMFDIAKLAKEKGLRTVVISSGYINQEPLKQLLPYIDAYKVDFKSINSETYQTLIRGRIEPVQDTIKTIKASGTWLELVHLIVPGYTDNMDEIRELCTWVKDNVGEDVPMHFSRFWPKYKLLNLPPTSDGVVKQAREVCMEVGLKYVYTGNIEDVAGSTTYCPDNNEPLLVRNGYIISENLISEEGTASGCPASIPGVWK